MTGPRLIVDGRALVGQRTGIGVHTAEIAARLSLDEPAIIASHRPVVDRSGIENLRFDHSTPLRPGLLWQQTRLAGVAARYHDAVLWAPHGTLPMTCAVPSVVTIHDLTSITSPFRHRWQTVASFNLFIGRSLASATRIAAVSRSTADALMRGFGVGSERIEIIHNGVSPFFLEKVADSPVHEEPYILYVGTIEPRKGISDLLAAWRSLAPPRPRLILAGSRGWGIGAVRRDIETFRASGELELRGFVSREELRMLYRNALCFVYPSLDEGFGLPPLEAMAAGAPVIASNGGAIPEVVGDAALQFEAGDWRALSAGLRRLMSEPGLRSDLQARGSARSQRFDWDVSAKRMTSLIVEAYENR